MSTGCRGVTLFILSMAAGQECPAQPARPLALHPDNPRYFLFRGKPAVLITSGESSPAYTEDIALRVRAATRP